MILVIMSLLSRILILLLIIIEIILRLLLIVINYDYSYYDYATWLLCVLRCAVGALTKTTMGRANFRRLTRLRLRHAESRRRAHRPIPRGW